jgi:N-acetylgalactosamine-6-sulfatase
VRVPFIVRWPGHTPAGVKNNTTVFTAVDLLPTFCAAAGVTPPADALGDGENLLAAFNGADKTRTRPVFWWFTGYNGEPDWWPRLAVRDGDWKLVLTDGAQRIELHHLTHDRAEATDVSKDHPDIVARLSKMALDWKATLPTQPNPECLSTQARPEPGKSRVKGAKVKPNARFNGFDKKPVAS